MMKEITENKRIWSKPAIMTITAEEMKKVIVVSACSNYSMCQYGFNR